MSDLLAQAAQPQSKNTVFIYGLVDPRTGFTRYIGKAKNPKRRYAGHLIPCQLKETHHRANWLRELLSLGFKPTMEILEIVATADWQEAEKVWIAYFRSIPSYPDLTNSTDGGDGGVGYIPSAEWRRKQSERMKNSRMSLASREKVSAAHRGRVHTSQARENMSDGKKEWWKNLTEGEKGRISSVMRAGITVESRAKAGIANRISRRGDDVTSKYRGVSHIPKTSIKNPWRAFFAVDSKPLHIGVFRTEEKAARARDIFILAHVGEGWPLNFPIETYSPKDVEKELLRFVKPKKKSSSGFRGVYWNKPSRKWMVQGSIKQKLIHLGMFVGTEAGKIEAAHAYDRWVIQHRGPTAYTNFPRHDYPNLTSL